MSRYVNSISGRLSLRHPQRTSLEILDRVIEIAQPKKGGDIKEALAAISSEFPTVTDFEREFPSLCFALATGVGKTRLMGAFISYLHLAHGVNNFFVMAPNLTIYNKLIADFTPNTPKYVFKGIAEFVTNVPRVITGDNYDQRNPTAGLFDEVRINIFNISKINTEVRGGSTPRIKKLSEYIGQSYFEYLSELPDLVMLMDESHRYRASQGIRAINELNPILGLELTATPFVERGQKKPEFFKNVVYDYPLARAMEDGYVKDPAVVTRENFNPSGMSPEQIERLKLEDSVHLHENVKVELETYARETGQKIVKPFVLVIARDTSHAADLLKLIQSNSFFDGRYKEKVIQVDSSTKEDEVIERLLKVEDAAEPTEIVIHVNMLKEGWDVTNLYTIVPLRAANARTLIEQSIGRGLRLPYGKRTGVEGVDRLSIVAHDKFQEIVDEANKPDSAVRLRQVIIREGELENQPVSVIAPSRLSLQVGQRPANSGNNTKVAHDNAERLFQNFEEEKIAQLTLAAIEFASRNVKNIPGAAYLQSPEVFNLILEDVKGQYGSLEQMELEGILEKPDVERVVSMVRDLVVQSTIDIPRIIVTPKGEVKAGFKTFALDLSGINYPAPSDQLWSQSLYTNKGHAIGLSSSGFEEKTLEDYVVSGLIDFDDVSYDENADLLYDLAGQVVTHLKAYLDEEGTKRVLKFHQREIVRFVYAQMQEHTWEEECEYEVIVSKGFSDLKEGVFKAASGDAILDYRVEPKDKSNMARYLFGGFSRCLYTAQRFHSDIERRLAVILERDSLKWFRPVKGQFHITYKWGHEQLQYQPDFIAEGEAAIYMLEPKMKKEVEDLQVASKTKAAVEWCNHASDHAATYNGKPWRYVLIPHDVIADNMTLEGFAKRYGKIKC